MFSEQVNEQTAAQYTATLYDQTGAVIPVGSLTALELWLYDVRKNTIINNRGLFGGAGQNVLNQNNVTVDANGLLTWTIQGADNVIVTGGRDLETHRAVFRVTWGSPSKTLTHELELVVVNMAPVA